MDFPTHSPPPRAPAATKGKLDLNLCEGFLMEAEKRPIVEYERVKDGNWETRKFAFLP